MTTGTFTSKDTYAGRIESILSQNRYTYAENNPVNFADPSGHAKTKSRLPSLQDNIRIAKGGNGPALKPTVNNPTDAAKAAYQSRRDAAGLPKENTLLDNVRIYNGQEYYNGLVLRTPVSALMSPVGGSLTFAESIAAKVEAARCMAYDRCENAVQESILEGKSKRNEDILLAVGPVIFFSDLILHIDNRGIGFRKSTEEFIAQYEGEPFLTVRINNDGTYTIGFGFDFSQRENPELFDRYLMIDKSGNIVPRTSISEQEAINLIKEAAEKKGIIDAVNDFVNGTGHGNTERPLEINQNQYDALMSYFYSNGANVFTDESYNNGIEAGGRYADRASGREALREYLIENNGNYNPQVITELFQNSLGGNIKYDYEERRTAEAALFNKRN